MKECDNSKIHISGNFILSVCLLIMLDTITKTITTLQHFATLHPSTLQPSTLHCTYRHFRQLSTLHYIYRHFNITNYECVLVSSGIQHAVRMIHIVVCGLPRFTVFFHVIT
jgi:hypothetical protein